VKIECPSCAAKYSIGDDKVQERLAKIRCRKCGTTIVIDGKQNPPHIYAADAGSAGADLPGPTSSPSPSTSAAGAGGEFTVDFGDGDQRNLTLAQVVSAYNKGEVTAEHYVWAEGFDDWRALGDVEQIVNALHASARSPMAATPAAVPRAAAIGGRGTDLFGGIDHAGSEEDVTTSAGSPDPMPSAPQATGARNESSVLFSLSALTSAAATAKPSGGGGFDGLATSTSSSKEDSGLIDLKALTAAAAASERRDAPAPMPMGLGLTPAPLGGMASAPLGLGSPLGGPTTSAAMAFDPGPMPQQKNRTGLYIAAGIVIAAVAVALIVVTSKEEPAPIPSATPIAAPAPTPTPTPVAAPPPTSEAQPPATGAAEADAGPPEEKKAPVASKSTWRPKKTTSTSTQTASKPAADSGGAKPPPKKKPSSGGCGCAPGDLQCAMRCAAGG